ncbi:MAG: proline dehydrogenase family protein [Acidimicrobiales bacterium]|nr:proline dehydrogenase family protein [Acidimicrobiales bacterium]HLV90013.1 proline dehydrogenase family protein [Acidimicrobiia bacterium]
MVTGVTGLGPVRETITGTRPGKALARRFVAGDTLDEAVAVARTLNADGFQVSLDLLGEEVHDKETALAAVDRYLECLDRIATERLDANIAVKPTHLGLAVAEELAADSIARLAIRASEVGTTVTIDMEDSRYTGGTVDMYALAQEEHGNLGLALQACMKRTPADLERLIPLGGHIRLCKGAYLEPPEVALTTKRQISIAYADQLRSLMASSGVMPAIATHDDELIELAVELAASRTGPFEFQMLYGVRPDLQRRLVAEGFPLRVYLPFGSEWYPYLTRRLAERPANTWFFVRALLGGR